MAPWEGQTATETAADIATQKLEAKPTTEEIQAVEWEQKAVKADAQKDLATLQWEISTTQKSKFDKMNHTNALKNNQEYRKQVEQILGLPWDGSSDYKQLKQDIKTLQEKIGLPLKDIDGALGPKTFDKLKSRWDARPKGQDYKAFINELMGRKTEAPTAPVITWISTINLDSSIQSIESIKPKLEINTKELQHDMENGMLRVGDEKINFELKWSIKTAFIDRDAYKIMDADDKDSYELNIRSMEDNVIIKKEDISIALTDNLTTIKGWTKPKKQWEKPKPVDLIINKEPIKQENKPDTVSSDATNSSKGLNIQTWDASKNADPENKDQVPSPVLNIQMDSVTSTVPEMKSDIVATIEASTTIQQANSAIPESKAIVA